MHDSLKPESAVRRNMDGQIVQTNTMNVVLEYHIHSCSCIRIRYSYPMSQALACYSVSVGFCGALTVERDRILFCNEREKHLRPGGP